MVRGVVGGILDDDLQTFLRNNQMLGEPGMMAAAHVVTDDRMPFHMLTDFWLVLPVYRKHQSVLSRGLNLLATLGGWRDAKVDDITWFTVDEFRTMATVYGWDICGINQRGMAVWHTGMGDGPKL